MEEGEAYSTKQKQNHRGQPANSTSDGRPENPPGRRNTRILSLLSDVSRGVEADEHTRGGEVRQTPIPPCRRAGAVVSGHEGLMGRAEAPGVGGPDGEPDEIEEEVQKDDYRGEVEDVAECTSCGIIS